MNWTSVTIICIEPQGTSRRKRGGGDGGDRWSSAPHLLLQSVFGSIEGEGVEAIAGSGDPSSGSGRDGLSTAYVVGDEIWYSVKSIVFKLVLDSFINSVWLNHHLNKTQS